MDLCWWRTRTMIFLTVVAAVFLVASPALADDGGETPATEERPGQHELFDETDDDEGIQIDVRVGARRVLIPLAVPEPQIGGGDASEAAERVRSVLRANLELAGYFDVLTEDNFFFDPAGEGMSAAEINFGNWFNVGAQGLIKSSVEEQGGSYAVDLRLYEVDQGRQVDLDWSTDSVDSVDGLRGPVNEFINAVIEHYTRDEGMFGTQIAYSRRHDADVKHIYTMGMDGSNRQRITSGNYLHLVPTFGPDRQLFFTSFREGNPDLYAYQGGSTTRISSRDGQNTGAAWCDGKLAATLSMGTDNTDIYLLDPESGGVERQLTDNWSIDVSPTWSPDCSQIAFVSSRSGGAHIFVMNADGSDKRRLTYQGSYNTEPDWSPRGDRIAFSARDERASFDIFTVDLEGNIQRLTQDQGNNFEPSYSPNGRYIVFSSTRGGAGRQLWLMTHDGQVQNRLTTEGSGYAEPAWTR